MDEKTVLPFKVVLGEESGKRRIRGLRVGAKRGWVRAGRCRYRVQLGEFAFARAEGISASYISTTTSLNFK